MKSIMKKTLGLLMILCMTLCALSFVKINVNATTGLTIAGYTQLTNVNEIVAGKTYLIGSVKGEKTYLLKSTATGGLKPASNAGVDASELKVFGDYEFIIDNATSEGKVKIKNASNYYLSMAKSETTISAVSEYSSTSCDWSITATKYGTFRIASVSQSTRAICLNESACFGAYATSNVNGTSYFECEIYIKNEISEYLNAPTNVNVDASGKITFTSSENATSYSVLIKDSSENVAYSGEVANNDILPINKAETYSVSVKAMAANYGDSDYSDAYNWTRDQGYTEKSIVDVKGAENSLYVYYQVVGVVKSINETYKALNLTNGLNPETTLYLENITNYDSFNFNIGDSIVATGYKDSGKLLGGIIIDHTVDYLGQVASLNTFASLKVSYGQQENGSIKSYALVTSIEDLEVGAKYVIGAGTSGTQNFLSTETNTNNRRAVSTTVVNNSITAVSGLMELELGGEEGAWTFKTVNYTSTNGFLNATDTTKSNYLKVVSSDDQHNKFSISFKGNEVIITCTGKATKNVLQNNDTIFACYNADSQSSVYLYKENGSTPIYSYMPKIVNEKNDISLKFCATIAADLKENLDALGTEVKYGIAYKKAGTAEYSYIEIEGAFVENAGDAIAIDEDLETAIANDDLYQLALSLDGIPATDFDTVVTAAGYVEVDGVKTLMNTKAYSINTIAAEYVANNATNPSVAPHLAMLSWLANYSE